MCVQLKAFSPGSEKFLFDPNTRLTLTINTTFQKRPIRAVGRIAWLRKQEAFHPPHYTLGVQYIEIDEKAKQRIFKHAQRMVWGPRLSVAAFLLLVGLLVAVFAHDRQVVAENRRLVMTHLDNAQQRSGVAGELLELQTKRAQLEAELVRSNSKVRELEGSIGALAEENIAQKDTYERELSARRAGQMKLSEELERLRQGALKLQNDYRSMETTGGPAAAAALKTMADWLKSHRNVRTGLVASFEGDASLEDTGFTYDQALAAQVFLLFGERELARGILDFYAQRAQSSRGAFFNAYSVVYGAPDENIIQTGPNLWLGIAALQYGRRAHDDRYLPLARSIGDWALHRQDAEGGLDGGPEFKWYSTEHNLDAYAFFLSLEQITGERRYGEAAERVLGWLKKYAYSNRDGRINRGKGDSTIATDTFSWAIAAVGPEKLKQMQFDPEGIMAFAEEHCEVKVAWTRPDGRPVEVRGFDFAKAQNLGRGGVISTEWTAQAIVTYRVLADHFASAHETEKAALYESKAKFYMNELQKLMITSPSRTGQGRGCLPYASIDNVDTGHGWRTPKGAHTGSVAATAYGIFAWVGYNPFDIESRPQDVG